MLGKGSNERRMKEDVLNLVKRGHSIDMINDCFKEFYVQLKGPPNTLYYGGVWRVYVKLPDVYPFKSPSIGFDTKIFHPNIDECSGSVCLDVINQEWTPIYGLFNIFETFLPQLLTYPNAKDPLNTEAGNLYLFEHSRYEKRVKEYVKRYATVTKKKEEETTSGKKRKRSDVKNSDSSDSKVKKMQKFDSLSSTSSSSTTTTIIDNSTVVTSTVKKTRKKYSNQLTNELRKTSEKNTGKNHRKNKNHQEDDDGKSDHSYDSSSECSSLSDFGAIDHNNSMLQCLQQNILD
ncbi:hypothetical protein SNEBB_001695 [Seison nebaliae]|nr:hypothetical protein SNEBB_001695 [Seison nebaliae]